MIGSLSVAALTPGLLPSIGWQETLVIFGIILFSGSLYLLAITGARWLGAITPLGGLAFIAGWVMLAVAALRGTS